MNIGQKIRKYRTEQGLSQKELAVMSGMSEPAIRNYELCNRTPNEKQLTTIASALGISYYSIAAPTLENEHGIMHALFELEDNNNLSIIKENGTVYLTFDFKEAPSLSERLSDWSNVHEKLVAGELSEEEYKEWKSSYPARAVFTKARGGIKNDL